MKESCVDFMINFPNPSTEVSEIPNKKKRKKKEHLTHKHHGVLNTEARKIMKNINKI